MEDVTNIACRRITKRIARPGLMFTEFVSAMAIHHGATKTFRKMRIHPDERPLGIQIFGGDPAIMAETARIAEAQGADLVDINMGCWVPKVCRTGSGAALLKDPSLAEQIVRAVAQAVTIPVTVKVRAGWDYSLFAAPDLARRFQGAGAKMITLHARFARQGFDGQANWDLIRELRESVTIPLIGNGDVRTPEDALRLLRETGADGVMVGRAAVGDPWALARIQAALTGQPIPALPTLDERIATALEHARLFIAHEFSSDEWDDSMVGDGETRALRGLRSVLPLYVKSAPGAAALRASLNQLESYAAIAETLFAFAARVLAANLAGTAPGDTMVAGDSE